MTGEPILNLGCGDDHHADALNVDAAPDCQPDAEYDLTDYPWPDDWQPAQTIRCWHVLEHLPDMERALDEAARILAPGGILDVRLPMGRDALADSTHVWGRRGVPWTWRTPEYIAGREHWQADRPLRVVDRDVELWSVHPSPLRRTLAESWWAWLRRRYGPGEWCFGLPAMCGDFRVVFRREES